jgi:transposase
LRRARRLFPFIKRIFADGGYAGAKMALIVWRTGAWKLEIVKRTDTAGFEVLPKRWIIGVSSEGHAVMSVKVRPEPKDSGFEAREAPWRESKTAEPSANMLERSMREASGCNVQ